MRPFSLGAAQRKAGGTHALFDFAAFEIVTLLVCFPHGEGFARKRAIKHHRGEERALGHRRQQEAQVAGLCAKLIHNIRAVNIIDGSLWESLEQRIQRVLQRAYFQLCRGRIDL